MTSNVPNQTPDRLQALATAIDSHMLPDRIFPPFYDFPRLDAALLEIYASEQSRRMKPEFVEAFMDDSGWLGKEEDLLHLIAIKNARIAELEDQLSSRRDAETVSTVWVVSYAKKLYMPRTGQPKTNERLSRDRMVFTTQEEARFFAGGIGVAVNALGKQKYHKIGVAECPFHAAPAHVGDSSGTLGELAANAHAGKGTDISHLTREEARARLRQGYAQPQQSAATVALDDHRPTDWCKPTTAMDILGVTGSPLANWKPVAPDDGEA